MKKIEFIIICLLLTISMLNASDFKGSIKLLDKQSFTLDQGNLVFSAGYGVPNFAGFMYINNQINPVHISSEVGPWHFKAEYFISDEISIGLATNIVRARSTWVYVDGAKHYKETLDYSSTSFNFRFNYHYFNEGNWDIYAGSGIGYRYSETNFFTEVPNRKSYSRPAILPIGFEIPGGVRYFIAENIGIYLETGLAKSLVQGGLAIKL